MREKLGGDGLASAGCVRLSGVCRGQSALRKAIREEPDRFRPGHMPADPRRGVKHGNLLLSKKKEV